MDSSYARDHIDSSAGGGDHHGWQKVTYTRGRKKQPQSQQLLPDGTFAAGEKSINVFRTIEEQSEDRIRRIEAERRALEVDDVPKPRSNGRVEDLSEEGDGRENEIVEDKKGKEVKKKEKKTKVSLSEAAAKIDAADLSAFLVDVSCSYGSQEEIQLMRFADFFGRAFAAIGAAQFQWVKLLGGSPIAKIAEIPLSHIQQPVYRTSVDWINQHSLEALNSFVLRLLDNILADLGSQSVKGSKKVAQAPSSKSQVAVFVALAMVLQQKPDVLVSLLPALKDNSKYQGQDKLPLIIWMVSQASQGDLCVGLHLWAHALLPILSGKSGNNPLSRDLILQLIERILSVPKARTILVNGAVRKGERLIPPSALEALMRVTFPTALARLKATERFEAVYPTLKEVALAGTPGSKGMKQVSQQIFSFSIKTAAETESNPELAKEAEGICIWCLSQSNDCYRQWEKSYLDNLEASVAILRKLYVEWKQLTLSQSSLECLKETLSSFLEKNLKELNEGDPGRQGLVRDSDKYCKLLLGRVSRQTGLLKTMAVLVIAMGVGAYLVFGNLEKYGW